MLDKNSVGLPNSRALIWQQFDYNNSRERDTRPLVMTQQDGEILHWIQYVQLRRQYIQLI